MNISILHLFFITCFFLLKMHYLDHLLECLIGPSLKVLQLRRLFDWTNMAAALPQFFGAARHPCFEVSDNSARNVSLVDLALNEIARNFALTAHYQIRCSLPVSPKMK